MSIVVAKILLSVLLRLPITLILCLLNAVAPPEIAVLLFKCCQGLLE